MNRFRRKSDARTRPSKPNNDSNAAAAGSVNADGSTTPAGEPPTVQLPNADEFRTSLILPNLMRRFSLLRGQDGQLVDYDTIQTHLAIQRQTGRLTAYEVDAVLEQYKWQAGIASATLSPSLPKRKRIDWSLVPDEAAFLDSLSQSSGGPDAGSTAASSSRTSSNINIDETQSSLSSSVTRSRLPPPVPHLDFSGTSLSLGGDAGGDGGGWHNTSPLEPTKSVPLSREPSSGAASTASQPRVKRGTNGFFGARAHDARELKILRSTSSHSLEPSSITSTTTKGADEASMHETALGGASPSLETDSPDPHDPAQTPIDNTEPPLRNCPTASSDAPPPRVLHDGDEEVPAPRSGHVDPAEPVCPPRSPTTPLSKKQLRRISHALDAIEVELAKTFARLSGTTEQDEEEGVDRGGLSRLEADDAGTATSPAAARDSGENADEGALVDNRSSEDIESASLADVPRSPPEVITASPSTEHEMFDLADASAGTVPPSPISPITESDLRGIGTFDSTAPRADFDAMIDTSALSDAEELDPFWTHQTSPDTAGPSGEAYSKIGRGRSGALPAAITIPPRPEELAGVSVETETSDQGQHADDPSQAVPAALDSSEHDAPTGAGGGPPSPETRERERTSAAESLARESFASLRSMGSSFHAIDMARPQSDEDCPLSIQAAPSVAPPSTAGDPASQPYGEDTLPRLQRLSAVLAAHPSASARPASLPFDRRPAEELLQVLAAATKRLSASDAGAKQYLTYEDVLAIQDRLVQKAATERAATAITSEADASAGDATTQDIARSSAPDLPLQGYPVVSDGGDEAVEQLAGLGLDDFASTDFTQPSPQQADAGAFSDAVEPSSGSSAGKPSPASVRSPTSIAMTAENSQRTYDSNVTLSSARSGVTTSPSDAFEYSSLVTTRTDQHGSPLFLVANAADDKSPLESEVAGASASSPYTSATNEHPSKSGETLPAGKAEAIGDRSDLPNDERATPGPRTDSPGELTTHSTPPTAVLARRVPRRTPAPDRSGATSILVRDVQTQATLATNALKNHDPGSSPTHPLRKKSVRKNSISSPQLVSGPINIPAVPIASPKILAEANASRAYTSPGASSPVLRRQRSVSDSKSKGLGSRFKRLLSKREGGSKHGADAGIASDTTKPARPSRVGTAPITPPNQATARFDSPQDSSPQTPSTVMSSPGGSTPRSSPRKKPLPSTVFPSKRSSLSQLQTSSPAQAATDGRERGPSTSQAFSSLQEESMVGAGGADDAADAIKDRPGHPTSFTRVAPLSPRRTGSRQDSSRTQSPTSPLSFRSGADRSGHYSRDSVESMLRFRQAAEGLGLDPDRVQELVSSAYADSQPGSGAHGYSGSISSSNGGRTTLESPDHWIRNREASHGSNATAAGPSGNRNGGAHGRDSSDVSVSSEQQALADRAASSSEERRTSFSAARFADAGASRPFMLTVPDRRDFSDSLAGPRSPGVESTTSRQSSSDYASSFLDYYAHEEGETDNEGPFNLSTGSTFDPRGAESIRFSVADGSEAQPTGASGPSEEVVWQVLDDLRTNRFSGASHGSSFAFGSHDSSNGADDPAAVDQLGPLLRHRDRKRSSASLPSDWDRTRFPSIYLREEQALIELGQQGGVAPDENGRFLIRPKLDAPAVPPLPVEYRDQARAGTPPATLPYPTDDDHTSPTPTHFASSP
ncbi:hypothetical protein JCM3774_000965 [Rhodotorula dairenensis]